MKEESDKVAAEQKAKAAETKAKQAEKLAEARSRIVIGATLKGKVVRVQPFGAFIDLGGIEGLCHVSEPPRARTHDANEVVKVGDEIEVQVLKLEDATDKSGRKVERIALSHKGFEKDPWADATSRFKVGDKIS